MLPTIGAAAVEYIPLSGPLIHPTQAHISWIASNSQGRETMFYANRRIRDIATGRIGLTMIGHRDNTALYIGTRCRNRPLQIMGKGRDTAATG